MTMELVECPSEVYFEKHKIHDLFARLLDALGRDQPHDPVRAIRKLLSEVSLPSDVGSVAEPPKEADRKGSKEECDTDESSDLDPFEVLVREKLGKENRGAEDDNLRSQQLFAGGFNRSLMEGWLPQPSPCCAAASVAGAFNGLWGKGRRSEGSSTIREVADLMANVCDNLRVDRQHRLERLLGIQADGLSELYEAVDAKLTTDGFSWTAGSGPQAVTKKIAMDAVRAVVAAPAPSREQREGTSRVEADEAFTGLGVFEALRDVLGVDEITEQPDAPGQYVTIQNETFVGAAAEDITASVSTLRYGTKVTVLEVAVLAERQRIRGRIEEPVGWISLLNSSDGHRWARREDGRCQSKSSETAVQQEGDEASDKPQPQPSGGCLVDVFSTNGPDWARELQELLWKRKGVMRLRKEKPNTGEIGSWGIKTAAEDLAAARGCQPIQVSTFMARKLSAKGLMAPISKDDDELAVTQQWSRLKEAFGTPQTVLLFHLTNHYALIYAWREWLLPFSADGEPRMCRQVLTARKGQRPTAWLTFDEVRSIMLGWSGYNILRLQRSADLQAPSILHEQRTACDGD